MKINYSNMNKAELIKRIENLEKERNGKKDLSPSKKKQLTHDIQEKDLQIATQKNELIEKQNQLDESRDKFSDFYDYAPTGYLTLDDRGTIRVLNLTAAELIGVQKRSVINTPFVHFLVTSDMRKFYKLLDNCKQTYDLLSEEFIIKNEEQGYLNIHLTAVPFHEYKTNKIIFSIYLNDITERKKSERIIEESEKRFRLMADTSPVMVWMTDVNNRLEYINKTKLDFLGKKFNELTNEAWLETRHPEERNKFLKELSDAAKEKRSFSLEIRIKNKDGDYRWLIDTAAPRFLDDGTFIGFIGSGFDITEEKNSRISLKKSLKEKEVLLREIHHRVKNNLQVISSLLNLQKNYISDPAILDIFRSSQNRIRSMALLHEKLYQQNNLIEIDLSDYIQDLISNLFDSYNLSSHISLKLNITDIHLDVDLSLNIGLIINELVSNALKHAFKEREKGEIFVELINVEKTDQLELIVTDDGVGIPEDYNLNESKTFGLELVSALIQQYEGSMKINRNDKTEFKIYLQYKEQDIIK